MPASTERSDTMNLSPYTKTALIAVLVNNDFHYIHLLAEGSDFDKIHNLAQSYYEKIEPEVDFLMELALENGADIFNYTMAGKVLPAYQPEDLKSYGSYQQVIIRLIEKITVYREALQELRDSTTNASIQSKLDDMIRYWEKEQRYRLARRLEL